VLNRGLAVFSFVLIVLGISSDFYPISILGGILLIAALLAPSRARVPRPVPTTPERRRVTRPIPTSPPTPASTPQPSPKMQAQAVQTQTRPSEIQTVTIPALFPTTMFPSMNPAVPSQQLQEQKPTGEKPESRDELLELGALAVLLRLLSG